MATQEMGNEDINQNKDISAKELKPQETIGNESIDTSTKIIVVKVPDKKIRNKTGSNRGRPTELDSIIQQQLFNYLSIGTPIGKCCQLLGIAESTVYNRMQWDKEFEKNVNLSRQTMSLKARNNVNKALENGNLQMTTWYLERKERDEFGNKVEIDQNVNLSGQDNQSLNEKLETMLKEYKGKVDL